MGGGVRLPQEGEARGGEFACCREGGRHVGCFAFWSKPVLVTPVLEGVRAACDSE
jgi:hypothetical protein